MSNAERPQDFAATTWLDTQMIGCLRVTVGKARTPLRLGTGEAKLLAYLLRFPGRHVREHLADRLFTDERIADARNSLRVALSRLHSKLKPLCGDSHLILFSDNYEIGLQPNVARELDIARFKSLLAEAEASESPKTRSKLLAEAIALYGPFLPELDSEWANEERARLEAQYLKALDAIVALHEESGNTAAALPYALKACQIDSYSDHFWQRFLRLCADNGYIATGLRAIDEADELTEEERELLRAQLAPLPAPKQEITDETALLAAVQAEYTRLTKSQRSFFRSLAVFVEGWSLEAARGQQAAGNCRLSRPSARQTAYPGRRDAVRSALSLPGTHSRLRPLALEIPQTRSEKPAPSSRALLREPGRLGKRRPL